ncbi:MAG: ABC transporter permease DevC [Gemmataceae bacterium]|nr:ABC transporter permease DevC [Gemmataceae bacterium]MDW8264768.1 ABC transporter permease DevC [Gemmataceae bacterium]
MIPRRVPLAWLNLIHDRRRFIVYVAGVAFAVVLMCMELGFYNALLDSTTSLIDRIDGELVILSRAKVSLALNEPFSRRRLYQALEVPGVAAAHALYVDSRYFVWQNRHERSLRPIRAVAYDLRQPVLDLPDVARFADQLAQPWTVLIDRKSKNVYGDYKADPETELSRRRVRVVGTFELGTDFTTEGTLLMSADNYARFVPRRPGGPSPLSAVEIGVVQLEPGVDTRQVQQALADKFTASNDVQVLTKEEFRQQEHALWKNSSPIGYVFWLGTLIGFIVGVVICYQILATDIADHTAEYATLKAIGYPDRYLTGVVLQEALLLALLGFAAGLAGSKLLYLWLEAHTGLPMRLTLDRAGLILVLTLTMCTMSGLIAIRKVQTADPAEVFG